MLVFTSVNDQRRIVEIRYVCTYGYYLSECGSSHGRQVGREEADEDIELS